MPVPDRMKIAHIILSRGFAGSERSTAESCNEQSQNHDVVLFVRRDHRKKGVSIVDHVLPSVRLVELPARIFTARQLRRGLLEFAPDIVHCHLRRSTRLIKKMHLDLLAVATLHIEANGPEYLQMDGLICNARWQLESLQSRYSGAVFKANNSLVPHRRLSSDEIEALRRELGVGPDDVLIAGVGRLHSSKGWDTLIRAYQKVKSRATTRLAFFGEGRLEATLRDLAGNNANIGFFGYRRDVKDLYQCVDLLVCPSRYEPLPRVILEAMDAGTPVIASNIGGCLELIEDYGGDTFQVDDVDDLRAVLERRLAGALERHRPDLTAHYVSNANRQIEDFYRRLIADKRS